MEREQRGGLGKRRDMGDREGEEGEERGKKTIYDIKTDT